MSNRLLSRRQAIAAIGATAGAATVLGDITFTRQQAQADDTLPLFIYIYFEGGWDTLMSLDPRDNTAFDGSGQINPALDLVGQANPEVAALLASNPTGMWQPSGTSLNLGPAFNQSKWTDHAQDMCVVRGIDMGTLAHEVGRRYFLTGRFPVGVLANGSGFPTSVAANYAGERPVPNFVLGGMEHYNAGLDPRATGLAIAQPLELRSVFEPLDATALLDPAAAAAVDSHYTVDACAHLQHNAQDNVARYRAAWKQAQEIGNGSLYEPFDFEQPLSLQKQQLLGHFGIVGSSDAALPRGKAAIVAQALTHGVCQTASVRLVTGLDMHFDVWQSEQYVRLRDGFTAVADLIKYLKDTNDSNGKPYWDRTTLVVCSEFARTPRLNGFGGRDHHLTNSCLLAGRGIAGGQVIGASGANNYDLTTYDFANNASGAGERPIQPTDVLYTVAKAMGLPGGQLEQQDPELIAAAVAS